MGNSPRDCGPGGQWLGFIFIWWGIVLMGSCPRTGQIIIIKNDVLHKTLVLFHFCSFAVVCWSRICH